MTKTLNLLINNKTIHNYCYENWHVTERDVWIRIY